MIPGALASYTLTIRRHGKVERGTPGTRPVLARV